MQIRTSQVLSIVAVIALLGVGWVAIQYQNTHQPDAVGNQLVDQDKLAQAHALPDAISIQALRERAYDGSDFSVGDVLDSGDGYTEYAISYRGDNLRITGTLTKPAGDGPFPVVVINHGLVDTATYTTGSILNHEMQYLAQHGYVVLLPDYRNHAGSDADPSVDIDLRYGYVVDVINAIVALRQSDLSYADTTQIGMIGHSMGGAVAMGVAVSQPSLVKAFVLYSPISVDMWTNIDHWMKDTPSYDDIIAAHGTIETDPRFWQQASPGEYLDSITAPILIHHGTADDYVPISYSEDLVTRLEDVAGAPVIFDKYIDQGHEFTSSQDESLDRTIEFFAQYVSP